MNAKNKKIFRLIGYILLCILFAAISAFFITVLISSNTTFFSATYAKNQLTAPNIIIAVIIAAIAVMAVLSVTMRKKPTANKALLYAVGVLSLLGAIAFMILLHIMGPFQIALENVNLYLMYFLFVALANAYIIFAAIHNLVKQKKGSVVFAKSLSNQELPESDAPNAE